MIIVIRLSFSVWNRVHLPRQLSYPTSLSPVLFLLLRSLFLNAKDLPMAEGLNNKENLLGNKKHLKSWKFVLKMFI